MFLFSLFITCLLVAFARTAPLTTRDESTVVQGLLGTDGYWNDFDGGTNAYVMYTGNGSAAAGWPVEQSWVSFNEMWITNKHIIDRSCDLLYKQPNNNDQESLDLYDAIKQVAHETRVDHRFILAVIMQETKGCVRAASSTAADGTHNPGLLQSYKGNSTCNDSGKVQNPCPAAEILGMVRDGIAGTAAGHGYAEDINAQANVVGSEVAFAYYRASRLYNSGEIDASGDLGKAGATHCYASDVANRLMGWTDAQTNCKLDSS